MEKVIIDTEENVQKIEDYLTSLKIDMLVDIYNELYQSCHIGYVCDVLEAIEDFREAEEIKFIEDVKNGSFDSKDMFYYYSQNNHLHTFTYTSDKYSPIDQVEMACDIILENNDCGYDSLRKVLNSLENK